MGVGDLAHGVGKILRGRAFVVMPAKLLTTYLTICFLFLCALPILAEEDRIPSIANFLEKILTSTGDNGHIDFSIFSCEDESISKIVECYDASSHIGFQYKQEEFGESINVNIVMRQRIDKSSSLNEFEHYLSIFEGSEYLRQKTEFLSLPEVAALDGISPCILKSTYKLGLPEQAKYFLLRNPFRGTMVLLLFSGAQSVDLTQKGIAIEGVDILLALS